MKGKCQCCWFGIILGLVLILSGIDNWFHFVPGIQLSNNVTAVVAIIVGLVSLFLSFKCKCCLTRTAESKPTSSPTSSSAV